MRQAISNLQPTHSSRDCATPVQCSGPPRRIREELHSSKSTSEGCPSGPGCDGRDGEPSAVGGMSSTDSSVAAAASVRTTV
jgi:hypothetical protein